MMRWAGLLPAMLLLGACTLDNGVQEDYWGYSAPRAHVHRPYQDNDDSRHHRPYESNRHAPVEREGRTHYHQPLSSGTTVEVPPAPRSQHHTVEGYPRAETVIPGDGSRTHRP